MASPLSDDVKLAIQALAQNSWFQRAMKSISLAPNARGILQQTVQVQQEHKPEDIAQETQPTKIISPEEKAILTSVIEVTEKLDPTLTVEKIHELSETDKGLQQEWEGFLTFLTELEFLSADDIEKIMNGSMTLGELREKLTSRLNQSLEAEAVHEHEAQEKEKDNQQLTDEEVEIEEPALNEDLDQTVADTLAAQATEVKVNIGTGYTDTDIEISKPEATPAVKPAQQQQPSISR
jgi:hypothetical protein